MIENKQVCDSYANWLISNNKWIYLLGIFCKDELLVSKDCDSFTKNRRGHKKRKGLLRIYPRFQSQL
jgi:hypothetical protein